MRSTVRALACFAAMVVVCGVTGASAQSISSLTVTKNAGNSADNFQDDLFFSFQRTSVAAVQSSSSTTFTTRYSFVDGTDTGIFTSGSNTLGTDYRINFNVTAPGAYVLNVNTTRNGALTLVDDGSASASVSISGVSGAQSGGTLSGSLDLPDPPDSINDNNGHNSAFDASSAPATISGTSNGVAKPHQLSFTWSSSCTSNSGFTGGDECAVRGGIAIAYGGESAGDYPGSGARNIATDGHFVTVTLVSLCGNGMVDGGVGEQCDEGPANGTSGSCCAANCTLRANGASCRPASSVCDLAETCDGTNPTCPTDQFAPSNVVCRAASSGMECDFSETCTGSNAVCPPDIVELPGTVCRPAAGMCDIAEVCDGVSKLCPTDLKSSAMCRPQNGLCDVAEFCSGGDNCPADGFANSMTVCRGAVDTCDLAENCTGSGPNCPPDLFKPMGSACPSDGNPCTLDQCNGASTACQHPAGNSGAVCRPGADLCDVAEQCDGISTTCPTDAVAPNGTACRTASPGELCDETEVCDGVSTACPADAVKGAGEVCRMISGDCDIAEECDGVSTLCPGDAFEPSGTECRAAASICDIAEDCTGASAACPADVVEPDGTSCDDPLFCNGPETCMAGACVNGGTPCGMGESCDEGSDQCLATVCPNTAAMCRTAAKSILVIKDKADNAKDKLIWKWIKGANTTLDEIDDPTTTASYALCFYAGPTESLIGSAEIPPSPTKWSPISTKGFKYKDTAGTEDGIRKVIVKSSSTNKSKALVKGKGAGLPDFTLPFAPGDLPIIVQLRNNDSGVCFESTFAAPIKNQPGLFKDKAP